MNKTDSLVFFQYTKNRLVEFYYARLSGGRAMPHPSPRNEGQRYLAFCFALGNTKHANETISSFFKQEITSKFNHPVAHS